ncbi:MAG: hypothetical protein LUD72_13495 [Bacteroidales bacterium]|nr:hypothetical protein [Bacteroidales bacterium]
MSEIDWSDSNLNTKTPEIQNILMSGRIGIISARIAELLGVEPVRALEMFYESETCRQLHNPETGLYLFGDQYIADEFLLEINKK